MWLRFEDDLEPDGVEQIEIAADGPCVYGIVIKAAPGTNAPGAYLIHVVDRRPATDADRALQESRTLRLQSDQLVDQGRFEAAKSLLEQALADTESSRGANDVQTAAVTALLAGVYRRLPDDAKSEALYLRALSILESALGADHPTTAVVRSRLALLYQRVGQRAKADEVLRQALDAIEHTLGQENPWFAGALVTQASLLHDGADFEKKKKSSAARWRSWSASTTPTAACMRTCSTASARAIANATISKSRGVLYAFAGDQHAAVWRRQLHRRADAAEPRYRRARAERLCDRRRLLRARAGDPRARGRPRPSRRRPGAEQHRNHLSREGRHRHLAPDAFARAEHLGHAAGPYQDATLVAVGNIARTYAAVGDIANAIAYQRRADAIIEKQLTLNLALGSERQKLLILNGTAARTDRTISLHLVEAPGSADAGALAALVLLQRKGRVQDAMADTFAAARRHIVDVRDQDLLDRLQSVTAELSRLVLSIGDPVRASEREQLRSPRSRSRKEQLEAELSAHCAVCRAQLQPVTLEAVQSAIPVDGALLEFAIFRPFDPRAERNAEAYGPPHYAAYVDPPPDGAARIRSRPGGGDRRGGGGLPQGAARSAPRADVKERARALDARVLQPLRAWFGDAARLLVSPDGELNLVPFEALVDEQGRYVIERHSTSYLTSGRDLLRMRVDRADSGRPVIFADPLFGERAASRRCP